MSGEGESGRMGGAVAENGGAGSAGLRCGESMIAWDHEDAGIGAGVARRRDAAGSEPGTVDAGAGRAETLCEGWDVRFGRFRLGGRALRNGGDRGEIGRAHV